MALKAFYDGSGKGRDPKCNYLTLAGFSASDETWERVETAWIGKLREHGVPYFHASEAFACKGAFEGWEVGKVNALAMELQSVLGRFRDFRNPENTDLLGFSCTVNLAHHRMLTAAKVIKQSPGSLCTDWCGKLQFQRNPEPTPGYLALFFDRDEEFLREMDREWRAPEKRRPAWAKYVATIAPIRNMRSSPALQMADLLAASMDRWHKSHDQWWKIGFLLNSAIFHKYYDEQAMRGTTKP